MKFPRFKRLIQFVIDTYRPVTPRQVLEVQLRDARLSRIEAAYNLEAWRKELQLQERRIIRLIGELEVVK